LSRRRRNFQQSTTQVASTQNHSPQTNTSGVSSGTQGQTNVILPNNAFDFSGSERIRYLDSLVSKQLELYTWCEEKVTTLATINAILLAGATLFVEHIKNGSFAKRISKAWQDGIQIFVEENFSKLMVVFILLPIFISLGISLWHVIPKMRSGKSPSNIRNHRSSAGIYKYGSISAYKNRLDSISTDEIYEDLVRQIYGMNTNIWNNQRSIKVAVFFDLVGLAGFFGVLLYLVFCGTGSNIFN
jgi:hypothetical protein